MNKNLNSTKEDYPEKRIGVKTEEKQN